MKGLHVADHALEGGGSAWKSSDENDGRNDGSGRSLSEQAMRRKHSMRCRRVLATGLPNRVTRLKAAQFFAQFGRIKYIQFSRDVGLRKQVFVQYRSRASVQALTKFAAVRQLTMMSMHLAHEKSIE